MLRTSLARIQIPEDIVKQLVDGNHDPPQEFARAWHDQVSIRLLQHDKRSGN